MIQYMKSYLEVLGVTVFPKMWLFFLFFCINKMVYKGKVIEETDDKSQGMPEKVSEIFWKPRMILEYKRGSIMF